MTKESDEKQQGQAQVDVTFWYACDDCHAFCDPLTHSDPEITNKYCNLKEFWEQYEKSNKSPEAVLHLITRSRLLFSATDNGLFLVCPNPHTEGNDSISGALKLHLP